MRGQLGIVLFAVTVAAPVYAVTEDFQDINLAGTASLDVGTSFNSSTLIPATGPVPAQGPGLVVNGISFGSPGGLRVAQNVGIVNPTQVLRTILLNDFLLIDFTQPVTAFSLDFIYNSGVTQTAHLDILGTDDTTVLQTQNFGSFSGANGQAFFFAVAQPGIGAVRITETLDGTTNPFFITVDNVTFSAVPEPSTGLLVATGLGGLVWWRKAK
jgi:PEP-CTERM motif-containing protein